MKSMRGIGWTVLRNDGKAKILAKGDLKISVMRVGYDKWKLEIFERNRILDGLGINESLPRKFFYASLVYLRGV